MNPKVLVVDDSALIRQQVARPLAAAGFEAITATDGMDALEKLAASPDIALVVSDINMPRMSGIELLERIRLEQSTAKLPFLILTTEAQIETIDHAKSLGAKGWLMKPVKPEVLVATVRKLTSSVPGDTQKAAS